MLRPLDFSHYGNASSILFFCQFYYLRPFTLLPSPRFSHSSCSLATLDINTPDKMELTSQTFLHQLPWMLYELSESCFVSLDLEMSGIPMSPAGQAPKTQSLQERYAENKAAAEKYQVLQFGLTICYEDAEKGLWLEHVPTLAMTDSITVGRHVHPQTIQHQSQSHGGPSLGHQSRLDFHELVYVCFCNRLEHC